MKTVRVVLALTLCAALFGCGEPQAQDMSKVAAQPSADLEKGKNATSIAEWASANPNNGAPGSGESGDK